LYAISSASLHFIPGTGYGVSGVTSLGEELFVFRPSSAHIDVYNVTTFAVARQLSLGASINPRYWNKLAASNNCVCASDFDANKVYRVELTGSNTLSSWSVGSCNPIGLSVNSVGNVLVACNGANKIQEYTTTGSLVREISLQSDVVGPLNVVQLSNNQFGVTHSGGSPRLDRYCVVGLNGTAVKCYGGSAGSGVGQLNGSFGLTLNEYGTVFIGDTFNSRSLICTTTEF